VCSLRRAIPNHCQENQQTFFSYYSFFYLFSWCGVTVSHCDTTHRGERGEEFLEEEKEKKEKYERKRKKREKRERDFLDNNKKI
jgi:hypothetical protein